MNRKRRREIQKIKKTIFVLFIVILLIILLCNIKSCSKNKKNDKVYGYALVSNNSKSKILELHTVKDNVELDNLNESVSGLKMKDNKLLYYTQNGKTLETVKYIDLKLKELTPITITNNVNLDYGFDITDKYLVVALQKNGIRKYDLSTKEETIILETIGAYDMFILDNKIYATTYKYENRKRVQKYYTSYLDGYNFNWIEKDEYDKLKSQVKTLEPIKDNNKINLIINDKKVIVSNGNKLMYGNEIIYSSNQNLKLMYTEEKNKIAFCEYTLSSNQEINETYFTYDIKTKEIIKFDKNSMYELLLIENDYK